MNQLFMLKIISHILNHDLDTKVHLHWLFNIILAYLIKYGLFENKNRKCKIFFRF